MSQIALTGNASGTGIVTLAAPNTNTNRTITLPDETGTLITTATPTQTRPAFSAYQSVAQQINNGATNIISLDTEEFDTNANFASNRFTPTIAGYYQINGSVQLNGSGSVESFIYKNGTVYKYGSYVATASSSPLSIVSSVVYLNGSTDYVELYGYSAGTLNTFAGQARVYFNGCFLRGA